MSSRKLLKNDSTLLLLGLISSLPLYFLRLKPQNKMIAPVEDAEIIEDEA
jgi:hypothetical protein